MPVVKFSEADIKQAAMGICQESCAFRGEPPCWRLEHEGKLVAWPPETCDEPGCMALAQAALDALLIVET